MGQLKNLKKPLRQVMREIFSILTDLFRLNSRSSCTYQAFHHCREYDKPHKCHISFMEYFSNLL